ALGLGGTAALVRLKHPKLGHPCELRFEHLNTREEASVLRPWSHRRLVGNRGFVWRRRCATLLGPGGELGPRHPASGESSKDERRGHNAPRRRVAIPKPAHERPPHSVGRVQLGVAFQHRATRDAAGDGERLVLTWASPRTGELVLEPAVS